MPAEVLLDDRGDVVASDSEEFDSEPAEVLIKLYTPEGYGSLTLGRGI